MDPVEDGINWYAYVENSPTVNRDPEDLFCLRLGCEGKAPNRKCKICIGCSCHGDSECPLKERERKPKKPWSPPPEHTAPLPYVLPPGAGEGAGLCDPEAACGAMAMIIKTELTELERKYENREISQQEYERRKAELEQKLERCGGLLDSWDDD